MGALVNVLDGHWRLGKFKGVYGLYFCEGFALGKIRRNETTIRSTAHSIGIMGVNVREVE